MYKWRQMTPEEREEALRFRKQHKRPWHSPPHWDSEMSLYYIVSAACYEHKHIAGKAPCRLAQLENTIREICDNYCVGRKVWNNCVERIIRSERHYWATVNYIHHNPVKHGFAKKWDQWLFGSAIQYLNEIGRDEAEKVWKTYPVLNYGKEWDK